MSRFTTVQIEPQILIADRPVEAGTSDLFKHQQLADQIVEGIRASESSQVHAISGRYGSGKTSVGNFTQVGLEDTGFDVIRLRALELNDESIEDSLIQTIHERLGLREQRTKTRQQGTTEWWRQLQLNALPFGLGFFIVGVVVLVNTFDLEQAFLQGLLGGLALVIMLTLSSLVQRNPRPPQDVPDPFTITTICVRDILKRTRQRPVVIMIEDLDRLAGANILAALEGFQRLTNTPGSVIHVVVELDEIAVKRALSQVLNDEERPFQDPNVAAEDYLSKLVTYRHRIPQQAHHDLLHFCEVKLVAAAHPYQDVLINAEDKPIAVLIPPKVKTPREAIQLLNAFSEDYSLAMKRNLTPLIEKPSILARVSTLKQLHPEFFAAMLDDHRLLEVADEVLTLGRNEALIDQATLRPLPEETLETLQDLDLLAYQEGKYRLPASPLYSYLSYSLQKAPVKDVRMYPYLYLEEPPKEEREQEVLRLVRSGNVAALRVSLANYNDRRDLVEALLKIFREAPKRSERNGAMKALIGLYDVLSVRLDYRYNQQIAIDVSGWLTEERMKELNLHEVVGLIEGLPQSEKGPLVRRLREVFGDHDLKALSGAILDVLVTRDARRAVDHVFVTNITQKIREQLPHMSARDTVKLIRLMRSGQEPESVAAQVFWTQAPLLSQLIEHVYKADDTVVFREMDFEEFAEPVRSNSNLLWGGGPQQMSDFIALLFQAPSWDAYGLAASLLKGHAKDIPLRSTSAMIRHAFAVLTEEQPEASDVAWLIAEAAPLLANSKDDALTKAVGESLLASWQVGDDEMKRVMLNIMASLQHQLAPDHPALEAVYREAIELPDPPVLAPSVWENWQSLRPRQQLEVLFEVAAQQQGAEFARFYDEHIGDADPLLSLPKKLRGTEAKRRALPLVLNLNQFMGYSFADDHLEAYLDIAMRLEQPLDVATMLSQSPLTLVQKEALCHFLDQLAPSAEADRLRVGLECKPKAIVPEVVADQSEEAREEDLSDDEVVKRAEISEPSEDNSVSSVDDTAMATVELSVEEVEAEIARFEALERERQGTDASQSNDAKTSEAIEDDKNAAGLMIQEAPESSEESEPSESEESEPSKKANDLMFDFELSDNADELVEDEGVKTEDSEDSSELTQEEKDKLSRDGSSLEGF